MSTKPLSHAKNNNVRLEKNILVLDIPSALQPIVWRLDLSATPTFHFALLDTQHNNQTVRALTLNTAQDQPNKILARFDNQRDAEIILSAISNVLLQKPFHPLWQGVKRAILLAWYIGLGVVGLALLGYWGLHIYGQTIGRQMATQALEQRSIQQQQLQQPPNQLYPYDPVTPMKPEE